nr:reelin [Ciona intestinalis]|eukprot:XP_026690434.1 reelin [Ciona intestinalis]
MPYPRVPAGCNHRKKWPNIGIILTSIFLSIRVARASNYASMITQFYPCNVANGLDLNVTTSSEVSLYISNNPTTYTPDKTYLGSLRSQHSFNYVVITAVVSSSSSPESDSQHSTSSRCMLLHQGISMQAMNTTTFYWVAPPSGTGCITVIVKASTPQEIVLNDIPVLRLCEDGISNEEETAVSTSFIFRENFNLGSLSNNWNTERAVDVTFSNTCGVISDNPSALFCNSHSNTLVTKPLNLTSASTLEFAVGSGTCSPTTNQIIVSYKTQSTSSRWTTLYVVPSVESSGHGVVHVAMIPTDAEQPNVEIQFSEEVTFTTDESCWWLDDVAILSELNRPQYVQDDMDPANDDNWLFLPGADITSRCGHSNSMMFPEHDSPTSATTTDVDLSHGANKGTPIINMIRRGGTIIKGACGHNPNEMVRVFNGPGSRSYCTNTDVDLTSKVAATFYLTIGGSNCSRSSSHSMDIQYFFVQNDVRHNVKRFHYDAYQNCRKVVVPIPRRARTPGTNICFSQEDHGGRDVNVWGVDSFTLVDKQIDNHYFMQFSINLACGHAHTSSVEVQYSTDHGRTWLLLQNECLPGSCPGHFWWQNTVYDSDAYSSWRRVTIPLPESALTTATRFRWLEQRSNVTSQWAIDDVYVGSDRTCPLLCSNNGFCTLNGCRCDEGYTGHACRIPLRRLPQFLSENFNLGIWNHTLFEPADGGEVGFHCGIISSGKALVFDGEGKRMLMTKPLNTTSLKYMQFTILLGRYSTTGTCQPPSREGEGIVLQYSVDGGVLWKLLEHISPQNIGRRRIVSITLPEDARNHGVQFMWLQSEQPSNTAVWALDDILITSTLFRTAYSTSVNFHMGKIRNFCGRERVLVFPKLEEPHDGEIRFAETQTFQISQGYILQAELVMGCGSNVSRKANEIDDDTTHLELQYSTNHGRTWNRLAQLCTPGGKCGPYFHQNSVLYASEYRKWVRTIGPLPQHTWSNSTRIRILQSDMLNNNKEWAVDNVYMGPGCPNFCHNHGLCRNGQCICDPGFSGMTCLPNNPLPDFVETSFGNTGSLEGWKQVGARVVGLYSNVSNVCGPMVSAGFLHLFGPTLRKLESPDLNVQSGGQIQFYLQIGGGNCNYTLSRTNGVILQYSTNGGATWKFIQEFYYSSYPTPTYINIPIPTTARTHHTRFRWWQPENKGKGEDTWSLDDIFIGERMLNDDARLDESADFQQPHDNLQLHEVQLKENIFTTFSNIGNWVDFCSPRNGSFVFNKLKGDRFAMTKDIFLKAGDVIQFQINIGCSKNFSFENPVRLEYSHDGGHTWDYVRHSCYPNGRSLTEEDLSSHSPEDSTSHLCTGASRELRESSQYHAGDYDEWKTVVIPVLPMIAEAPSRFRWTQRIENEPLDWAIHNVYIGPNCVKHCSGHGVCTYNSSNQPQCICDSGYESDSFGSCSPLRNSLDGFSVNFNELSTDYFHYMRGGKLGNGCGNIKSGKSIYFGGEGTRLLQTNPINTTNIRLVQFYLKLGNSLNDEECLAPTIRDEGILFQYSNDNGITWKLIKELYFDAYQESPTLIKLQIPLRAKTESTIFRWWQPLPTNVFSRLTEVRFRWAEASVDPTCQWKLDNVYLGNGCPWMCSGHGYCEPTASNVDVCRCDHGYDLLPHCQPSTKLPSYLKDDFNLPWSAEGKYSMVIGNKEMNIDDITSVGIISQGENIQFSKPGIRLLQTVPMNTTEATFLQFYLTYQGDAAIQPINDVIVQASINNGITWTTIHQVDALLLPDRKFVNVMLPVQFQHEDTMFKLWSGDITIDENESSWAIDNLIIGGQMESCNNYLLTDDFNILNNSNWAFNSGGKLGSYCTNILSPDISSSSLLFNQTLGETSVTTRDLCFTSSDYLVMFKIAVGCDTEGSSEQFVRFEYSTDNGQTWDLVQPYCDGRDINAHCSFSDHPSSVYYTGYLNHYQNIIISLKHLPNICSLDAVRFRWFQGFHSSHQEALEATPWSLDNVYIGPGVGEACGKETFCKTNQNLHSCHDGSFYAFACCNDSYPTFFYEDFEWSDSSSIPNNLWSAVSGGSPAPNPASCDWSVFVGKSFLMNRSGDRQLITGYLDTRKSSFIQFYLRLNLQPSFAVEERISSQFVLLQYSIDGGLSWKSFETFSFQSTFAAETQYVALMIPEDAQSNATMFKWWQPSVDGNHIYDWSIDHIIIGETLKELDEDFNQPNPLYWLEMASSAIQLADCCNENCVSIGGDRYSRINCGKSWIVTNGVKVNSGSFIQFYLSSDCGKQNAVCHDLVFEYSKDLGHTWQPVVSSCNSINTRCVFTYPDSLFLSDEFSNKNNNSQRVIIPLREHTWSQSTRFRWIQLIDSSSVNKWSIDDVYIGSSCPGACSGHGRCHQHKCICDDEWKGDRCEILTTFLPTEVKDIFETSHWDEDDSMYATVVGGVIDDVCGDLGFETALHFTGGCSRKLTTVPLDTTDADFVQFNFRFSCNTNPGNPVNRDTGVMIDYSRNGGITWNALFELYNDGNNEESRFVNIMLPRESRGVGVQIRWWQPSFTASGADDWAIDNLFIGGKREEKMLSDAFTIHNYNVRPAGLYLDRDDKDMWQFYDNTYPSNFCGRMNVIRAGDNTGLPVSVGTKDFVAETGYILQYTIVVMCGTTKQSHQPVHVQYSTDFGDSWQYVTPQCLPSDIDCFGKEMTQPTVHFASQNWRRKTIWLSSKLLARPIRFRLHQYASDTLWALDRLYIGLACPEACSGHGDCVKELNGEPYCICDDGYTGTNCYLQEQLPTYLKDTFASSNVTSDQWHILDNAAASVNCGRLMEGDALVFDGPGHKQAETIDLDLRDARFVQYHAAIGGTNQSSLCLPVHQRSDGLLLQYSTNAGISWHMLNELDYLSYNTSTYDYITLPLNARTNSTRLLWWQPYIIDHKTGLVMMGTDRAGWAIENVYIGGNEVNSPKLEYNFESNVLPVHNKGLLSDESFNFYPHGTRGDLLCGSNPDSMTWNLNNEISAEHSLTTRQLIVAPGYMIQFKINVGCGSAVNECSKEFHVRLEYKTNPMSTAWQLVREECFPTTVSQPDCTLFSYNEASIYEPMPGNVWKRVTIPIDFIEAETTQFRWYQRTVSTTHKPWALDDIYIGEQCPDMCMGHGKCVSGPLCVCDLGYRGSNCGEPIDPHYVQDFKDSFEDSSFSIPTHLKWSLISGGSIGYWRCGSLAPHGSGKSVHFDQCGKRILQTVEMNLMKKSYVQYVLQIGSLNPSSQCASNHSAPRPHGGAVLLQYSINNGITWDLLREHVPSHYMRGRRVFVRLPTKSRTGHTVLRWWQPTHGGHGRNQWGVDNVEVIMSQVDRHLHNLHLSSILRKFKHTRQPRNNTSSP